MKRNLTFYILIACLLLVSCNKYARPGQSGNPPVADPNALNANQQGIFNITDDGYIPKPIPCGLSYGLTIRVSDIPVECEAYNFAELYNQAIRHFDRIKTSWKCDNDCNQLQTFIVAQSGTCPNLVATVIIKFVIRCDPAGAAIESGLARKPVSDLGQPFQEEIPHSNLAKEGSFLAQYMKPEAGGACPVNYNYKIVVSEKVFSCLDVNDYRPYIDKAKAMSQWVWDHTDCPLNCRKQNPEEVGAKWGCSNDKVQVEYWFKVECKP